MSKNEVTTSSNKMEKMANWETWSTLQVRVMKTLASWVRIAQAATPHAPQTVATNSKKLIVDMRPTSLIDPEIVMMTGLQGDLEDFLDELPENCVVPMEYFNGWAQIEGKPIWDRLDGELTIYHRLFKEFLDLRQSFGTRAVHELASRTEIEKANLDILSKIYHWTIRSQAYDDYLNLQLYKKREQQINIMENTHQKTASNLFTKAGTYLENLDFDMVAPKDMIKLMHEMVMLERLSLGLPKDKVEEEIRGSKVNTPLVQINTNNSDKVTETYSSESDALNSNALAIAAVLQQVGGLPGQTAQEVEYKEVDKTEELMKDLTDKLNLQRKETQGDSEAEKLLEVMKDTISEHKGDLDKLADDMAQEVIDKVKKPKTTEKEKKANKGKN